MVLRITVKSDKDGMGLGFISIAKFTLTEYDCSRA